MTRVLVADDSETVLLMLQRRLEQAGYEVMTAIDGQSALAAIWYGQRPDVVILDAMMPGKSGIDALRELRQSGDDVPVLILSAHRYSEEPEEVLRIGADGCIGKPFEWDGLVEKIEELAGRGHRNSSTPA